MKRPCTLIHSTRLDESVQQIAIQTQIHLHTRKAEVGGHNLQGARWKKMRKREREKRQMLHSCILARCIPCSHLIELTIGGPCRSWITVKGDICTIPQCQWRGRERGRGRGREKMREKRKARGDLAVGCLERGSVPHLWNIGCLIHLLFSICDRKSNSQ